MREILYINAEEHLQKGVVHTLNTTSYLFPFTTKKTKYLQGNFKIVISELARNITQYDLKQNKSDECESRYFDWTNELSEFIAKTNEIEFTDEEARVNFLRLIDTYLFNEQQMKVVHPYLYNFIGKNDNGQTEINHLSEFIASVFIGDHEEIQNIFKDKQTDNILTRVIIKEIEQLVEKKEKKNRLVKRQYSNLFPNFTKLFQEDLQFLVKHKEFFIANFEMFLHYYVFMYMCQSVIQLESIEKGHFEEAYPLYFALDWEPVRRKRPVADDLQGFKYVKEKAANLFSHEFVLRSLSYNTLNDTNQEVYSYSRLLSEIESHGEERKAQFIQDLKEWIQDYMKWVYRDEELPSIDLTDNLEELFSVLLNLVKTNMNSSAKKEYGHSIENLGVGVFLKQRGNLGYLLNMNHDFLLMMTAVIVKDKRIPFNTLIEELEKRGIALDRHSIEEIITLFNNHNILDKKSDSGDAQYVKPIL